MNNNELNVKELNGFPRSIYWDMRDIDDDISGYAIKFVTKKKDHYDFYIMNHGNIVLAKTHKDKDEADLAWWIDSLLEGYYKKMQELNNALNFNLFVPTKSGELIRVEDIERVYTIGINNGYRK